VLLLSVLVFLAALLHTPREEDSSSTTVRIYFLNPATNSLDYEERTIPIQDHVTMTGNVLSMFLDGPKSANLQSTVPDGLTIVGTPQIVNDSDLDNSVFEIEFSKEYNNMTPIQEVFFRAAFVWTITSLDFINNVHIYADGQELLNSEGKPIGLQNRINIDIHPVISPDKTMTRDVTLYFADETGTKLVPERRTIQVNQNLPVEQAVVAELIKGPQQDGHYATISPDVKVLNVNTEGGVCFVNLSADYLTKKPDSNATDAISVYSIVDSLSELKVKKVQFLIESETPVEFKGDVDLSKQFERNDVMIEAAQ
jgi:germination protein M